MREWKKSEKEEIKHIPFVSLWLLSFYNSRVYLYKRKKQNFQMCQTYVYRIQILFHFVFHCDVQWDLCSQSQNMG